MSENPEPSTEAHRQGSELLQRVKARRLEEAEKERLRDELRAREDKLRGLINQRLTAAGTISGIEQDGHDVRWNMTYSDPVGRYRIEAKQFRVLLAKNELPRGGKIEDVIQSRVKAYGTVEMGHPGHGYYDFELTDPINELQLSGNNTYKDAQIGETRNIARSFDLPPSSVIVAKSLYGDAFIVYDHFIGLIEPAPTPQPSVTPPPLSQG